MQWKKTHSVLTRWQRELQEDPHGAREWTSGHPAKASKAEGAVRPRAVHVPGVSERRLVGEANSQEAKQQETASKRRGGKAGEGRGQDSKALVRYCQQCGFYMGQSGKLVKCFE